MNTQMNTTMLKLGVWLQTQSVSLQVYTGPTLGEAFRGLYKKLKPATPLDALNKERMAMGYAAMTNSEWLAARTVKIVDQDLGNNDLAEQMMRDADPIHSHEITNIYYGD